MGGPVIVLVYHGNVVLLVIRKCLNLMLDCAAEVGKKAFLMDADR